MSSRARLRRLAPALILLALVAIGLIVWRVVLAGGARGARTVTVQRGTLQTTIETTGKLVARRSISVSSPAGGQVRIVAAREGERVQRGDVLAVLDDGPARADIAKAERLVEVAETRVAAARQRATQDPTTLPDVATAEREASDARAALAAARERLAATLLLAPFDGLVTAVRVSEGATYTPGAEAFTLVDPSDLYASGDLDEIDRPSVRVGQQVTVTVLAFPGTPFTGQVATLSDVAQTRGGTTIFPFTIEFTPPQELALLPGMSVELRVVTAARQDVLLLPSNAIRRAGDRQYVVVRRAGQDVTVEVHTGARSGGEVEIASGLQEGDVVVLP